MSQQQEEVATKERKLDDAAKTELWLFERFRGLGFSGPASRRLALDRADWHAAAQLLERGCPHPIAYRLLRGDP